MIARLIRRASRILASLADALDDRGAHHGETIAEDARIIEMARRSRTGGGR